MLIEYYPSSSDSHFVVSLRQAAASARDRDSPSEESSEEGDVAESSQQSELRLLRMQLTAAQEELCLLREKQSVMVTERDDLQQSVAQLHVVIEQFRSSEGKRKVMEEVCQEENEKIWKDTEGLVANLNRRSLDQLLALDEGAISEQERNEFARNVVRSLTLTKQERRGTPGSRTEAEKATQQRRELHRALAVEHMYCARNSNYVAEFNVAAMAVAYSVSSSRLVVNLLGRMGPGGSYTLLKNWLKANAGEPVHVPEGVVAVAFDNEQRLCKNYLTRQGGKVVLDIMTNIVACVLPEDRSFNDRESFKICHCRKPKDDVMLTRLQIPDLRKVAEAKKLRDDYVASRLSGVLHAPDRVAEVIGRRQEKNTIQCPRCKTVYERRFRNCHNLDCAVTNIREALAKEQSVVREPQSSGRRQRSNVVLALRPQVVEVDGVSVVQEVSRHNVEKNASECKGVKPADVHLVEPCFVNPASLQAIEELLRHIGKQAGIKSCGGSERDWLAVTSDGVPYYLVRKAIQLAQRSALKGHLAQLGWVDTQKLTVPQLKDVLRRAGLACTGLKNDLLARVDTRINKPIMEQCLANDLHVEGEFDWVVPCMGGLHQEFMICRSFLDVNWDVAYRGFALSQGYHGDRQLLYIRSGKDHHKTFDDISRYVDGICDELLLAFVASSPGEEHSVDGFFAWLEQKGQNLTVKYLAEQCFHYAVGIQLFRRGTRLNSEHLTLLGWRLCAPLVHCRNHPKYQLLDVIAEIDQASQPSDLRQLVTQPHSQSVSCSAM